jgi:LysR family transcriptional regulator, hydrogen peroxide-inducible genes activator
MNIQQFQYILAVAEYQHFESAAEKCNISQSTLSTMISKFEDEIGIKIFDRRKKPVGLTLEGSIIIEQIRLIVGNIEQLHEVTKEIKGEAHGNLNLSIIPTVAPSLLPLFLKDFALKFPNLNIVVKEETTETILKKLKSREIDIGIVSVPLLDKDLLEIKLYDEPFLFYDSGYLSKSKVSINKIKTERILLMEEGHCMRTQMLELCNNQPQKIKSKFNFEYKAGSIDGLIQFVKANKFATLLPYLSTLRFSNEEKEYLSSFTSPTPYRTIGLIVHRYFVKKKVLDSLHSEIVEKVSSVLPTLDPDALMLHPLE